MQTILTTVIVLVAICARFTLAQDELIGVDIPIEYEENIIDIWEDESSFPEDPIIIAQETLLSICDQYDISISGQPVDCSNIKLSTKTSDIQSHILRKREVDIESPLEGSGEEPEETQKTEEESPPEIGTPANDPNTNKDEAIEETNSEVPVVSLSQIAPDSEITQEENQAESVKNTTLLSEISTNTEDLKTLTEGGSTKNADGSTNSEAKEAAAEEPIKEEPTQSLPQPEESIAPRIAVTENAVKEEQAKEEGVPIVEDLHIEEGAVENEVKQVAAEPTQPQPEESIAPRKAVTEEAVAVKEEQLKEGLPVVEEPHIEEDEASPILLKNSVVLETDVTTAPVLEENLTTTAANVIQPTKADQNEGQEPAKVDVPAALPSDLAETDGPRTTEEEKSKAVDEVNSEAPKETETVDEHQSGNAVINFSEHKEGEHKEEHKVEGSETDKTVINMATSADSKSLTNNEQPNAGESSKDLQKAGKDTTVLVVLFAIVVSVGVLAFAYNYVKKKKQRAANESAASDGNNVAKRTLPISTNGKTDIEQGTELKPLIKNSDPNTTAEYSDKGKGKVEEISEK